jgi:hypothetical protein
VLVLVVFFEPGFVRVCVRVDGVTVFVLMVVLDMCMVVVVVDVGMADVPVRVLVRVELGVIAVASVHESTPFPSLCLEASRPSVRCSGVL